MPTFYIPGNLKMQMKTPKFLFALDFTAEIIEEEYPIAMMLALAEEVTVARERLWNRPNFDRDHYCRCTHDDNYPAWADQHDYHYKSKKEKKRNRR